VPSREVTLFSTFMPASALSVDHDDRTPGREVVVRPWSKSTVTGENAMKYLCLVYADEAKLNAMPQPDIDALIDEVLAG
jgi:hypothetical protein